MSITTKPFSAYQRMSSVSTVSGATSQTKAAASTPQKDTASDQQIAKVSISSEARLLAAGASQGALDPQKVSQLKTQLDNNQLNFDSAKIAEKLVAAIG
jgi:anti-sigma28 factor (negative regulator of flagellin synthesis)